MEKVSESIKSERRQMPRLAVVFVVVGLSGFITYFFQQHSIWQQWTFLLHTLLGLLLTFMLAPYIWIHFRRSIAFRRAPQLFIGLLTISAFIVLIVTGIHISVLGQYESLRWIYDWHILFSFVAIVLLALHLLVHFLKSLDRGINSRFKNFNTLDLNSNRAILAGLVISIVCIVIFSIGTRLATKPYSNESAIQPYETNYGPHPFRPSQAETITKTFLDERQVGRSDKCQSCHKEITEQWRDSIHSQSATDPAFQTNVHALISNKGPSATRYCFGCHGPVVLLSGQATKGGKFNGGHAINEGVSCMGCHGIAKVSHLNGVASYVFTPKNDYLFANSDNQMLTGIHDYLIKINPREHRRSLAPDLLGDPRSCATCHVQYIDKDINNWGWVRLQDQYGAWLNGPYSGRGEQTFAGDEIIRCQDCHFPLVKSDDPSGNRQGLVRSHRTPGANTAIPYLLGNKKQLDVVTRFMKADRVHITIEQRKSKQASSTGTDLQLAGKPLVLDVVVSNTFIGHNFPAGTIDLNEPWIELKVVDASDRLVFLSGGISQSGDVDQAAHFYRSLPINRQGKLVWKHDLFNVVGSSFEKLIPPGKSDIVKYQINIPSWAKGPLNATARLRYRKFNNRYAKWALKEDHPQLPIVDMASAKLDINLTGSGTK